MGFAELTTAILPEGMTVSRTRCCERVAEMSGWEHAKSGSKCAKSGSKRAACESSHSLANGDGAPSRSSLAPARFSHRRERIWFEPLLARSGRT